MKILVTGANGQLGQELQDLKEKYPAHQFYFFSHVELDIVNAEAVDHVFAEMLPDYCINCAAYTAVDKAESEQEQAFQINAQGVQNLASASKKHNCRFIHISTDYVFPGNADAPYFEEALTGPIGVYGASKLRGEVLCLDTYPDAVIIRTSWVFSSYGNNFVKTMLRLMPVKESLNIVGDQQGCPTYAADLAAAILEIISSGKWQPGIYHYSNSEITNWHAFATAIKEHCGFSLPVNAITTDQYPTPAKRPAYSVLDTNKIRNTYAIQIRDWKEALAECLTKLNGKA
ncbi:MAG: dTDP-4-dehydrorhamnose reductase [Flaviaesturariibacter sp.]|nr:dTDP-4-dehydrorhamnose reductase [Flaviaesturariibacter sp.]